MRYTDGFRGGSVGVDGEGSLAILTAVTNTAAASSALLKVLWGSASRSQVSWGVSDLVLTCSAALLSFRGCTVWCFLISCGTCTLSAGS